MAIRKTTRTRKAPAKRAAARKPRATRAAKKPAARGMKWWNSLTKKQQTAYLKEHPNSKFGKGGPKTMKGKMSAARRDRARIDKALMRYDAAEGRKRKKLDAKLNGTGRKTVLRSEMTRSKNTAKNITKAKSAKRATSKAKRVKSGDLPKAWAWFHPAFKSDAKKTRAAGKTRARKTKVHRTAVGRAKQKLDNKTIKAVTRRRKKR